MKFPEKFANWSETKRNVFVLSAFAVVVAILLLPFAFFGLPGLTVGWILGSIISIFAYTTIVFASHVILRKDNDGKGIGLTVVFSFLRMVIYAAGLALGALVTFVWKNPWLNFWTVFAGYMPMPILVAIMHFYNMSKEAEARANPLTKGETLAEEEKKDE